jgi:NADH-quinone oxidoreductase subunit N
MTWSDLTLIAPLVAALLVAVAIIAVDMIAPGRSRPAIAVTLVGLAIVAGVIAWTGQTPGSAFGGSYTVNALTAYLDLLFVAIIAMTVLFGPEYLGPRDLPVAEFAAVLVFAMTGAMLIAGSADLLVLFVALELMILPGYLLAGFSKHDALSTEGAIKYFLLGSFSSAILLFGLAYVWGLTGTTRIDGVAAAITATGGFSPALALALALLTTGVAFKLAAVPFHYWTPDAYQGSPTPVTGFLSVGPKVGAIAIVIRLFVGALGPVHVDWMPVLAVLAVLTMTLGNLVAVSQTNVKRMLAYSSIAHTGYILVGFAVYANDPSTEGLTAILFYAVAYAFMNLGAFAVVAALQKRPGVTSQLETFAGLGRREPLLGLLMTLFLLSLTGIPPTAGFFAKALIILAAVQASAPLLGLAVVLNAIVAAFYYLRVVVYMYMREPQSEPATVSHGALLRVGLAIAAAMTILIGLLPGPLIDAATNAAKTLLPPI